MKEREREGAGKAAKGRRSNHSGVEQINLKKIKSGRAPKPQSWKTKF